MLLRDISNSPEIIQSILTEIINTESECSFVTFKIKSLKPIAEHHEYNGIRAKIITKIKNTLTPFDLDMGLGDVIIPKPEYRDLPTQLEGFEPPKILTYSLESTIAEKFDAILSRLELGSRMKDYYDIYYLAHTYDFDGRKLQEAISQTLQNRGTSYESDTMKYIESFTDQKNMVLKWNQYKINTLKMDIEFSDVMDILVKFLSPIFDAMIKENEFFKQWNAKILIYT